MPEETAPVGATLTVLTGSESGRFVFVDPEGGVLGRGDSADYSFTESGISRSHARITLHGSAFVIEDLGSQNGTYIDGVRLVEPATVPPHCRIRLGMRSILQFQEVDELGARAMQKLSRALLIDPLTGTGNRYDLEQRLHQEVSYARRHHDLLGVMLLDLDGLKPVNDRHGHAAGDQLLSEVGEILLEEIRAEDSVFRYGGDEFCILTRGVSDQGIEIMADRIRKRIGAHRLHPGDDGEVGVTVSIGIATNAHDRDETSPELMLYADRALYRAKQQGKDRVVLFGHGGDDTVDQLPDM